MMSSALSQCGVLERFSRKPESQNGRMEFERCGCLSGSEGLMKDLLHCIMGDVGVFFCFFFVIVDS